jgi:hypothetical protein
MQRSTRGPRPADGPTEDRKAIEQRARDAAAPFAPQKKGQWPFPVQETNSSNGATGANDRKGDGPSGRSSQPDQ